MELQLKYLFCIGTLTLCVCWAIYISDRRLIGYQFYGWLPVARKSVTSPVADHLPTAVGHMRALYASSVAQIDISGTKRKLSVFVNYAFATCEDSKQKEFRLENLEFFLRHGVTVSETANIAYGITISGESVSASSVTQRYSEQARQLGLLNVFILHRQNDGYDFGAHAAMLDAQCKQMGLPPNCDLPYDAWIFLNDGVRGPFLPYYVPKYYHWSQAFVDKLTALRHPNIAGLPSTTDHLSPNVALVGTSIACLRKDDVAVIVDPSFFGPKVEGFAFAVTGKALAYVRKETTVFSPHTDNVSAIIWGEYNLTRTVLFSPRRWGVTSLLKQHEGIDFRDRRTWDCNNNTHPSRKGSFGPGSDIAPLEVIFHKARWHSGDRVSENIMTFYSGWQDQIGGSYGFSTENSLLNQMANEASTTAKSGASTLVSYVYGGSVIKATIVSPLLSNGGDTIDVCDDNLDVFLKRGYSPNMDIDFVFTLLQGRKVPKKLQELARKASNVFIHNATWDCGVDLCQHRFVANKKWGMKNYSEFVFLNCGARGPYGFTPGPGQPIWYTWYRNIRGILEEYDAIGPTISPEYEHHLQTYMIAVSSRSIHIIDTLWHPETPSMELLDTKLTQLNISAKHFRAVSRFLKSISRRVTEQLRRKLFRIALGEMGLSFVLLSNGKKLHATCFDARTLGVPAGEGEGKNPTCCAKRKAKIAPECLNPNMTMKRTHCLTCPQLDPKDCIFVKFGGDVVRRDYLSPWTYARVSEYDLSDLAYKLSIVVKENSGFLVKSR